MLATAEQYAAMLDGAAAGGFALPAINVTSSQTLNAAMRGFAEAGSDGIVQITVGGARYLSGPARDAAAGARALAALARELAAPLPVAVALPHRSLPAGARRRVPAAAAGGLGRARGARRAGALPLAHVRRLDARAGRRTCASRRSCSSSAGGWTSCSSSS